MAAPTTVFIIAGGAEFCPAKGQLNKHLADIAEKEAINAGCIVHTTRVCEGNYDAEQEVQWLIKADLVIFIWPAFWFSVPPATKAYIDTVLCHGKDRIWEEGLPYGDKGMLHGQLLSVSTWGTEVEVVHSHDGWFAPQGPITASREVIWPFRFCGLKPLDPVCIASVHSGDQLKIDKQIQHYRYHLRTILKLE